MSCKTPRIDLKRNTEVKILKFLVAKLLLTFVNLPPGIIMKKCETLS